MSLKERLASYVSKDARLKYAIALVENGDDPQRGFSLLSELARDGNVEAQFRVARAYLEGLGAPPSLEEGMRWVRRAADAGHVQAAFVLATLYAIGLPEGFDENATTLLPGAADRPRVPDFAAAFPWARKAADSGYPDAQALVGYIRTNGPPDLADLAQARDWYERSAAAGSAQGHLGLGLALLRDARTDDERQRGVAELTAAAEAGMGSAFYFLGWTCEQGLGHAQDFGAAARHFEKAAERGVAAAQARIGLYLLQGKGARRDASRAETWLRRAALRGDADSAAVLGDMYVRGEDMPPNYLEAAAWYRIAADRGHGPAARGLGLLYLTGTGVHRDADEAARWFRVSAQHGDRIADADLGNLALSGLGSDADREAMRQRFERAARDGDLVGAFNLGVCFAEGVGVPRDEEQAAYWMHRAADGVVNAQYWLGRMYIEGRGFSTDIPEGCRWLERAAEVGMPEAQTLLAQMLLAGRAPGGRDHPRALELYRAAAARGDVGAMFSVGAMYGGGHDVPENRPEAQRWFRLAAERGHGLAQMMLARYLQRGLAGETNPVEARMWLARAAEQGAAGASAELSKADRASAHAR